MSFKSVVKIQLCSWNNRLDHLLFNNQDAFQGFEFVQKLRIIMYFKCHLATFILIEIISNAVSYSYFSICTIIIIVQMFSVCIWWIHQLNVLFQFIFKFQQCALLHTGITSKICEIYMRCHLFQSDTLP